MKRILHLFVLFLIAVPSFGQTPRPFWVDNTPFAPNGSGYIFAASEGVDSIATIAANKALANAIQKAMIELGERELSEENMRNIEKNGLAGMSLTNSHAVKITGTTLPFNLKDKSGYIVYTLIQVQSDINLTPNFYILPDNFVSCCDLEFDKQVADYNKKEDACSAKIKMTIIRTYKVKQY